MRRIGIFLLVLILFSNCKKQNATPTAALIFGTRSALCNLNCANFYLIRDAALYQDTNHSANAALSFVLSPLPGSKYQLANSLVSNIPQYLRNDTGGSLGCPGCADGVIVHLEFTDLQRHTVKWDINSDTTLLPAEIRSYIQQVSTVLNQL